MKKILKIFLFRAFNSALFDMVLSTRPIYGYRRIHAVLNKENINSNPKKILNIMRDIGIKAIYSKPRTTVRNKKSIDYNILANTDITRPNQAWQTDITYLRTKHGFMYLVAIIDSFTRSILSWRLSNSLSIDASLFCLTDALSFYKKPDLLHSDQGSQFTSEIWSDRLKKHKIAISLSGRGKSNDNAKVERLWRTMKYEYIYLYGINNATNLKRGINDFVNWYNRDRPHQALGYKTPDELMKEYSSNDDVKLSNL